jgi:hypothetical protein|tara:strand:- start:9 stop:401 length:393 start_codon:yes stop_codon:yes gene_type:complete
MATIIYKDAKVLYGGRDLSADHNELSIEYASEMLDVTTFGDSTRINKGGLSTASVSGTGFWNGGTNNADSLLFGLVGDDVEPLTVFGDGITEGAVSGGYSMKAVVENYNIGTAVGSMLTFNVTAQGRGIK